MVREIKENVVTHVDYRGRGYASECLNFAGEIAKKEDCYKMMLLTGSKDESTLNFYKNKGKEEILVPINAFFEDKGSNVYLFKDGKAVKTPIELGELRETDKISVVKGLKTGDKVIVAGVSKLADGEKVKLLGGSK